MDRINGADTVDIGAGRRGFRAENLATGTAGTEVTDLFLNMVQEEICKVIEASGLDLDPNDWSQLAVAIQSGKLNCAVAAGTANALTAALVPALPVYVAGLRLVVKLTATNTGPMTINVDGLGAVDLLRSDGVAAAAGDAVTGSFLPIIFDGAAFRAVIPFASQIKAAAFLPQTIVKKTAVGAWSMVVPEGVSSLLVRLWGGGGGGGYSTNTGAASGGTAGAYAERRFEVTPGDVISGVVGAGGVGGSASPARQGQPGLDTTVTVGGVTVTAGGGPGGNNASAMGNVANSPNPSTYDSADFGIPGGRGFYGVVGYGPTAFGGNGGAAPMGGGAAMGGVASASDGAVPGGGASASGSASYAGGTGARGEVQIIYATT